MTRRAIDPSAIERLRQLNQPGQPDLVQQVLSLFVADAPVRLDALARAVEERDPVTLQRAAHAMKGAASNIGATELQEHCRALEALGKSTSFDGAEALVRAAREEFERVRVEAGRYVSLV